MLIFLFFKDLDNFRSCSTPARKIGSGYPPKLQDHTCQDDRIRISSGAAEPGHLPKDLPTQTVPKVQKMKIFDLSS
jgi:hypothetical protein